MGRIAASVAVLSGFAAGPLLLATAIPSANAQILTSANPPSRHVYISLYGSPPPAA